jgi:hypothetical protein
MNPDPWTSDDPQPGDFDAVLETIDPDYVERRDGDPEAKLRILVSVEGVYVRRATPTIQASSLPGRGCANPR